MKVHYFAIRWPTVDAEIQSMRHSFKTEHIVLRLLCTWEEELKNKQTEPTAVRTALTALIEGATYEVESDELMAIARVCEKIETRCSEVFDAYANCQEAQKAALVKRLHQLIKTLRQEYWLAWLEDFYCSKVDAALADCMGLLTGDTNQRLFIVAFPEFAFTDSTVNKDAFYRSVTRLFLDGLLPKDITRTGQALMTLGQLTAKYHMPNREIVIFAGTIVWKELGKFYNMAPVFFQGSCSFLWEKQRISGVDGKSSRVNHRHAVTFGEEATFSYKGTGMAGDLTVNFLAEKGFREVNPVFTLPIFGIPIRFAVTVCLDMFEHDIIGAQTADIHILIAAGRTPEEHYCLINICAGKIFLYCDKTNGRAAMYRRGDKSLWLNGRVLYKWEKIDKQAMKKRYNAGEENETTNGVYKAPNVEDF